MAERERGARKLNNRGIILTHVYEKYTFLENRNIEVASKWIQLYRVYIHDLASNWIRENRSRRRWDREVRFINVE